MNANYSKVITMTLQDHGKEIFDNITTNNALLALLKKKGNIKVRPGGRSFTHPIYYALNSSFGSYGKLDPISTPLPDNFTRAEYPIKIVAGSLVVSDFDEATNSGEKTRLLDLVEQTKNDAINSMSEVLGDQLFKDGTGADDFDGLPHLISDAPSSQTDVGGINPTTYSYWRNYVYDTSVTGFNTSSAGLTAFDTILNQCTFGRRGPKAIITTKAIFQLYHIGLTSNVRYVSLETGDLGFRQLAYATMPVLVDDNCTASHAYFIDTESMWFQVLEKGNMKISPFEPSHNQLTMTALMKCYGNMTAGERRTSGVATSITG